MSDIENLFPPPEETLVESNYPDFISSYISLISGDPNNPEKFKGITDAPRDFIEASAYFLISTFVGRKFVYVNLPETNIFSSEEELFGGTLLNLWFLIIGKSRVSRKTKGVVKRIKDLIKEINPDLQLSQAFTPEYLIKEMASKSERSKTGAVTHCAWVDDECAWFFESLQKKDYMAMSEEFLCKMYDGEDYARGTIGRGKEYISNPYLTVFLASTDYVTKFLNEISLQKGFLNRIIYVMSKRERWLPRRTDKLTEDEKNEVRYIVTFLRNLHEKREGTAMTFRHDAKVLYEDFEKRIEERIEKENLEIKEGYYANLPDFVLKIACLNRIARLKVAEIKSTNTLIVEKEDVKKALAFVKKIERWFEGVLEMRVIKKKPKKQETLDRIYKIILSAGVEGITRTDLLKKSGLLSRELDECVKTLVESSRVNELSLGSTGGKPPRKYFAVELMKRKK